MLHNSLHAHTSSTHMMLGCPACKLRTGIQPVEAMSASASHHVMQGITKVHHYQDAV